MGALMAVTPSLCNIDGQIIESRMHALRSGARIRGLALTDLKRDSRQRRLRCASIEYTRAPSVAALSRS